MAAILHSKWQPYEDNILCFPRKGVERVGWEDIFYGKSLTSSLKPMLNVKKVAILHSKWRLYKDNIFFPGKGVERGGEGDGQRF